MVRYDNIPLIKQSIQIERILTNQIITVHVTVELSNLSIKQSVRGGVSL